MEFMATELFFKTWGYRHTYQVGEDYNNNFTTIFVSKNDKYLKGAEHIKAFYHSERG